MKNPLVRWFFIWIGAMVFFMFIYGVFGPKGRRISLTEINFKTTQSSELYFKNLRSYFYSKEEHPESGFLIYRLESTSSDSNKLGFDLIHNWRMQEAYILATSAVLNLEMDQLVLLSNTKDTILLEARDAESEYSFAAKCYAQLTMEKELSILNGESKVPLTEREKKSLQKTLVDYFRLVGKIR